jgi:iron-sulfur cluster assembly protein
MTDATLSTPTPAAAPTAAPAPAAKPARGIGIGDSAVKRLQQMLAERGTPEAGLRVAVKGGGCSGLAYVMEWAEKPRERDKIFERDGVRMFVDPKSYLYLVGTELIYHETLMESGFKLNNPNVKSACGCGESFTI